MSEPIYRRLRLLREQPKKRGSKWKTSGRAAALAPQPLKPLLTGSPARRDHLVPISCALTTNTHDAALNSNGNLHSELS